MKVDVTNDFSERDKKKFSKPNINRTYIIKVCSVRTQSISVGYLIIWKELRVDSYQDNVELRT